MVQSIFDDACLERNLVTFLYIVFSLYRTIFKSLRCSINPGFTVLPSVYCNTRKVSDTGILSCNYVVAAGGTINVCAYIIANNL